MMIMTETYDSKACARRPAKARGVVRHDTTRFGIPALRWRNLPGVECQLGQSH